MSVDCRNGTVDGEKTMTLQAKDSGGMSLNCTPVVIVSDMRGNNMGGGNANHYEQRSEPRKRLHAHCYQETGRGWWRQSGTAETVRTPAGGGGMMANVIVEVCE